MANASEVLSCMKPIPGWLVAKATVSSGAEGQQEDPVLPNRLKGQTRALESRKTTTRALKTNCGPRLRANRESWTSWTREQNRLRDGLQNRPRGGLQNHPRDGLQNRLSRGNNRRSKGHNRLLKSRNHLSKGHNRLSKSRNHLSKSPNRLPQRRNHLPQRHNRLPQRHNHLAQRHNRRSKDLLAFPAARRWPRKKERTPICKVKSAHLNTTATNPITEPVKSEVSTIQKPLTTTKSIDRLFGSSPSRNTRQKQSPRCSW